MTAISRYRKIYTRLWSNPEMRKLDLVDKLIAIYLLTTPQANRLGFYRFSLALAAEDMGLPIEILADRLPRVLTAFEWLHDPAAGVICIPSWFVWNPPENENVLRGALRDLTEVPTTPLYEAFQASVELLPKPWQETFRHGLANVARRFRQRSPNQ